MFKIYHKFLLTFIFILITCTVTEAQTEPAKPSSDTLLPAGKPVKENVVLDPYYKNVIKFNPTPMLLWGSVKNLTFSYERLIKKNQSLNFQLGFLVLPRIIEDTILSFVNITSREKYGVNFAADYRFYPSQRNRRPAPDGLYLAPYISYYGFYFKNGLNITNTDIINKAELSATFNIVNVGFSLGYQFIFWKRASLDLLLFGPSLSAYMAKLKFEGELNPDSIDEIDAEMIEALKERFPIISMLFSGETLRKTGYKLTTSPGFRFSVQFGFHF